MTRRTLRAHARWFMGLFWSSACLVVSAQGTPQKPPSGDPPPPVVERPAPPEAYSYRSEGRRDPFLSLVGRASDGRPPQKKPEGVRGLTFAAPLKVTLKVQLPPAAIGPVKQLTSTTWKSAALAPRGVIVPIVRVLAELRLVTVTGRGVMAKLSPAYVNV